MEFPIPEGFALPEGVGPGKEFDVVSTFRVKDNGEICLVVLGDSKMPGYDEKSSERETRPSYAEFAKSMGPIGQEAPASGGY